MERVIHVAGRDMLADAIESLPLDEATVIHLLHRDGITTYRFPAVCHPDGSEVVQHGRWDRKRYVPKFATPEEHVLYQQKRRKRIADQVRRAARGRFE